MRAFHYERAGLAIVSDWTLPTLRAASAPLDEAAPITIRRGSVPEELQGGQRIDAITFAAPGSLLVCHPRAGRFLVTDGQEIIVEPIDEDLGDLRPFVLSSGFAAICIQRGRILLHASAVAIEGRAVAFAGHSGAGKSTLLSAFMNAGHGAISDDLSLIDAHEDGAASVWPDTGYARLWPDSVAALGLEDRPARPELSWSVKQELPLTADVGNSSYQLAALFLLQAASPGAGFFAPMRAGEAAGAIARQLFRPHYTIGLGRFPFLMPQIGKIAAEIPIFRLHRPDGYEGLPPLIEAVRKATAIGRAWD